MAGLLAHPVLIAFPFYILNSGIVDIKTLIGLTAAGTAPEFHRIPY